MEIFSVMAAALLGGVASCGWRCEKQAGPAGAVGARGFGAHPHGRSPAMTTPIVTTTPPEAVKADALVILHTPDGGDARTDNDALAGHAAAFARDLRRGATRAEWFCTMEADAGVATRHVLFDSATFGPW